MKQSLLQKHRRFFSGGAFVFGLSLLFFALSVFSPSLLSSIMAPAYAFGSGVRAFVSHTFAPLFEGVRIAEERDAQSDRILMLETLIRDLEDKGKRYDDLLYGFGFELNDANASLLEVVAWPPFVPYDILLTKSPKQVIVGSVAYAYGMVPVGLISRAYEGFAEVRLFTSPEERTQVWVGGSHIPSTLVGQGGGSATITLPLSEDVTEGDPIYFPREGGTLMGVVGKKEVDITTQTMTLFFEQAIHPYASSWLLVPL